MEDERGALLALQKHDRVRSIDLRASPAALDKLFAVMDGSFPALEELVLDVESTDAEEEEDDETAEEKEEPDCLRLPQTFKAPHLSTLDLSQVGDVITEGLPLLASLSDLVTLALRGIPVSFYLPIKYLASCLSLMPRLEYLCLGFEFYIPDDDIGKEPVDDALNVERISLPVLQEVLFKGDSCYLDGLAARVSAPLLTRFSATFFQEPSSTLPHLSGLLSAAVELAYPVASIRFSGMRADSPSVTLSMAGSEQTLDRWPEFAPFQITFWCGPLDLQVACTGQLCSALTPMLSAVERLHLDLDGGGWGWGTEDDVERARWHVLLRPFRNVEKLQIDLGLMTDLSLALCPDDDGPSMEEMLPELRKLTRPDYTRFQDVFDGFIAARRDAGQQITKRRRPRIPCSDSEEVEEVEEEDEEEDENKGETKGEEGGGEEQNDTDSNTKANPDAGTDDECSCSTELDSDSDLDSE
jgi:hypothetical protein